MPLSNQALAHFLWAHPFACERRGLSIYPAFYALGRRYQQLPLGFHGEVQQVHVRYSSKLGYYFVQLVFSTTGTITTRLYLRAKQQLFALRQLLPPAAPEARYQSPSLNCVLVGQRIAAGNGFPYALSLDPNCRVFVYSQHALNGLLFHEASKRWASVGNHQDPALQELAADLLAERADALTIAQASRADALAGLMAPPPTRLADLQVTPDGILATPGASH